MHTLAVVLAGGRGTRLWPLSIPERPKPTLSVSGRSLAQAAVDRVRGQGRVVILTAPDLLGVLGEAAPGVPIVVEPSAKGTGPAVALAVALAERDGADVVIVTPADHVVADEGAFAAAIGHAVRIARATGEVTLLGMAPDRPDGGFGYIVPAPGGAGDGAVERFVEKPHPDVADALITEGALWNAGVFVVPVRPGGPAVAAIEKGLPGALAAARALLAGDRGLWEALPSASFDRAVLERATSRVVRCACGWSDVGTIEAFATTFPEVGYGNRVHASSVRETDSQGCIVWAPGRDVELVGVTDVIVVEANGKLLIRARES